MTPTDLLGIIDRHEKWLKGIAGGMRADLSLEDLYGYTLVASKLRSAKLAGANLGRCALVGADLGEADLFGASFAGADLRDVDLSGSDLRGVNLRGAGGAHARPRRHRGAKVLNRQQGQSNRRRIPILSNADLARRSRAST